VKFCNRVKYFEANENRILATKTKIFTREK
jgi:hypothetical protein